MASWEGKRDAYLHDRSTVSSHRFIQYPMSEDLSYARICLSVPAF